MMTPTTCRAARGLLHWSQQRLADAAHIGVSTVKKFEAGKTAPIQNNLLAMRGAMEGAGVVFFGDAERGIGVRLRDGQDRGAPRETLVDFLRGTALTEIDIHREPDRGRDVAL